LKPPLQIYEKLSEESLKKRASLEKSFGMNLQKLAKKYCTHNQHFHYVILKVDFA